MRERLNLKRKKKTGQARNRKTKRAGDKPAQGEEMDAISITPGETTVKSGGEKK